MNWRTLKLAAAIVVAFAVGAVSSSADEKTAERDWRTGVAVAPGGMTWTGDNYGNKKHLIDEIASSQGKTCTDNYAFIGWGIGQGGPGVIIPTTQANYEKAGFSVEPRKGSVPTDTIWIVRSPEREAVVLWGDTMGSTIYLSCLTTGKAAPDAEAPFYPGIIAALALAALIAGWWLYRRKKATGKPT
jgi:hypothetical protein